MLDYVKNNYPQFVDRYIDIIDNGNEDYYTEVMDKYANNERVKILF